MKSSTSEIGIIVGYTLLLTNHKIYTPKKGVKFVYKIVDQITNSSKEVIFNSKLIELK